MKRFLCMLAVCLLAVSALAETVQDQALTFLQEAGIAADGVNRIDNEIIVTLEKGGTASLWTNGDFDMYDLSWRFENAADEDVAFYLDHALALLAAMEEKIPADESALSAAEAIRVRSYAQVVDRGLACLEQTGEQGLRILLAQMEAQADSSLNDLRSRLAARLTEALPTPGATPGAE